MRKFLVPALCALLLAGCQIIGFDGQQDADLGAVQAHRNVYDAARSRVYSNISMERVLAAAEKIFELSGAGYEIMKTPNGFVAHRSWISMPGEGPWQAWWYVAAWPVEQGVVMRVRLAPVPDPHYALPGDGEGMDGEDSPPPMSLPALPDEIINPTETTLWELTDAEASVGLLFMRMEWLLGKNAYWLYCNAGREYAKIEKWRGGLDAFCVQAEDLRPDRMPPIKLPD